jgi:SAM-dependent methyltransferase
LWIEKSAKVYGVEPNESNIANLEQFVKKHHLNVEAKPWGGENPMIRDWISTKSIDVVMMVYSLTFFFSSEKVLNQLVANIEHCLRPGGKLIIIGMDGDVVQKWFTETDTVDNDFFTITKLYKKVKKYGNEIKLTIKSPTTLVDDQTEYLVDFKLLKTKLKKYKLLEDKYIKAPFYLAEWPAKFIESYRLVVFQG